MKTTLPFCRLYFVGLAATMMMMAALAGSCLAQQPDRKLDLLKNGSFEKGLEGWQTTSHRKNSKIEIDKVELYKGQPTLKIDNLGADDSLAMQKVTVKPMTRYRLTGFVKTKDIKPGDKDATVGANVCLRGGFERSEDIMKTRTWGRLTLEFETGPKTEVEVGPRLDFFSSVVTGTAWFADLSLVELGPARR